MSGRQARKINKLLIANRGEIAIRIHRACKELGIRTLAIFSNEDRFALHRSLADESVLLKAAETPVQCYLNIDEIVRIAREHGCDAVHPGYGFLSERSDFAAAVEKAGLMFVGPKDETVLKMGDKVQARHIAIAAGVPVIPGTEEPVKSLGDAETFCREFGFPVMLKAAYGGGGRGMRKVFSEAELPEAFQRATSEALAAFGNGSMFIEKLVQGARHVEVQVIGDHFGNVVHLFERDCTVQRRHQKVVEIAPAPFLPQDLRAALHADAVKLCQFVGYQNAGTVEFLVDVEKKKYFFLEVNARLQVEHTVTEEVTGIDLVKSQLGVREGNSLESLGLVQEKIALSGGCAIQCRITTEDASKGFVPDTGRIDSYRPAQGIGIRLDGAVSSSGAVVTPYYDSLLVKLTSRGKDFDEAVARAMRALNETKIRGVTTNIPFLQNVFRHENFVTYSDMNEKFIENNPQLTRYDHSTDKGSAKVLSYLAQVIVNGPQTPLVNPGAKCLRTVVNAPSISGETEDERRARTVLSAGSWAGPPDFVPGDSSKLEKEPLVPGFKQIFEKKGAEGVKEAVLAQAPGKLLLTDTTMRDAHQSLFATRMRTFDLLKASRGTAEWMPQLFSVENWGGATFDVAYRFLREDPWERLRLLREQMPNILFQMLFRGANAVGYTAYPDNAVEKFCTLAVREGMDVFRIFDSLNYMENMKLGIHAVGQAGGIVEAAISYTGNVADRGRGPYTLEYYMDLARQLVDQNIHFLCIKDMAGLLTPPAATLLIGSLKREFPNVPIHLHMHDTAGAGVATYLTAAEAGAHIVDVAIDSMSGLTSQPSMGALVNALKGGPRDTLIDQGGVDCLANYWEQVRGYYAPFDCTSTLKACSSDVYSHEIPGGQYTNLHMQAWALGMAALWPDIKNAYRDANLLLGDIVKVTPSSKVVGDMAQFMVQNGLTKENILEKGEHLSFPSSVVEYFQGFIGQPPFGFPPRMQTMVLRGAKTVKGRPGESLAAVDFGEVKRELEQTHDKPMSDLDVISSVMYPSVFKDYQHFIAGFGDVSILPTSTYFTGMEEGELISVDLAGRHVDIKFISKSPLLSDGSRDVYFEVMGLPRTINVVDTAGAEQSGLRINVKAEQGNPKELGAPMPGSILGVKVKVGDKVKKGDPLLILEATKMETVVVSPRDGEVGEVTLPKGQAVKAGDLLIRFK